MSFTKKFEFESDFAYLKKDVIYLSKVEIDEKIGTYNNMIKAMIKMHYEEDIEYKLTELFEDYSNFNKLEFLNMAYEEYIKADIDAEIINIVYFSFFKYITYLTQQQKLLPKTNNLLYSYRTFNVEENDLTYECLLNRSLSLLTRKQFDYFMNKYLFLEHNVKSNKIIERQIKRLFEGYGDGFVLKLLKTKMLPITNSLYIHSLRFLSYHFICQIGGNNLIIKSEDLNSVSYQYGQYSRKKTELKIGVLMFLFCLIAMTIYYLIEYL